MILALIIALPFMGALLPLLAERGGRTLCAASAGVAPLIGLILLLGQRGTVFAGQTLTASYSWLPEIGINLSLRLDGLGFLFALLILGIGLLVILYARYYLSEQEPMGRFFAFLLLFMGSMLGVVLAENLLLMMLFWEADQPVLVPAHRLLGQPFRRPQGCEDGPDRYRRGRPGAAGRGAAARPHRRQLRTHRGPRGWRA